MNKLFEILGSIGLQKVEIKVYTKLLELQEAQTGEICNETGIASSNIYRILESLFRKGLVSYRVQNNIKVFMASPPEALDDIFLKKKEALEEERKRVREIIAHLKKQESSKPALSKYKYYEGIVGIKSMWHEINRRMKCEDVARFYTTRKSSYERLIGFYTEHHRIRQEKNVRARMIFPFEDKKLARKRRNKITEIRFACLENDAEWGVIGDLYQVQYIIGKIPRAFLIDDKIFAQTYRQVFDQLWDSVASA